MTVRHKNMRLWTHYVWIFAAQFFTISIYAVLFFQLRRRISQSAIFGSSHAESLHRLKKVVAYMVIYPIAYTVLSLPLAAGRMSSAHGNPPSVVYFCVAGAMMACSGICDTVMYTLTRKSVVLEMEQRASDMNSGSYNKISHSRKQHKTSTANGYADGTITNEQGVFAHNVSVKGDAYSRSRSDSTVAIVENGEIEMSSMRHVYQHTTIEVTHEPAFTSRESVGPLDQLSSSTKGTSPGRPSV